MSLHSDDPTNPAFIERLWADLDDPGPWLVLTDWLTERRDPRAVLLRHALVPGVLQSVGDHWSRLRHVHEKNGFDGVGALPPELSFLIAARELLRVPSRRSFAGLRVLTRGLTDGQWSTVRPPLEGCLDRWPDVERFGGRLASHLRQGIEPPRDWSLVRSTSTVFGTPGEGVGHPGWLAPLTHVDAYHVDEPNLLEALLMAPQLTSVRFVECGVSGPRFVGPPRISSLSLVDCMPALATLSQWHHGWSGLRRLTAVGNRERGGEGLPERGLSTQLVRRLESLVLVNLDLQLRRPDWEAMQGLRTLALLGCRLPVVQGLVAMVTDGARFTALRELDLRWLRTSEGLRSALEPLPSSDAFEQLEAVGLPSGGTADGFLARTSPLPRLRRLALSGGLSREIRERWLSSEGTLAPRLESLDLDVDAPMAASLAWARALDRWPRLTRLAVPVRMVDNPAGVEAWMASSVFRGLQTLVLRGRGSTRALRTALAEAGSFPRILRDLGSPSLSDEPLGRDGFVVDVADHLYPGPLERTWAPLGSS